MEVVVNAKHMHNSQNSHGAREHAGLIAMFSQRSKAADSLQISRQLPEKPEVLVLRTAVPSQSRGKRAST